MITNRLIDRKKIQMDRYIDKKIEIGRQIEKRSIELYLRQ